MINPEAKSKLQNQRSTELTHMITDLTNQRIIEEVFKTEDIEITEKRLPYTREGDVKYKTCKTKDKKLVRTM